MTTNGDVYTKFKDIPQYIEAPYAVDMAWVYLRRQLEEWDKEFGVELQPDFQRAHVWTTRQRIRYIEYILRGGKWSNVILFNCTGWQSMKMSGPMVLVDGLQRVTSVYMFLDNEIPAFGTYYKNYEDKMDMLTSRFRVGVNNLETKAEVLQWYLELNDGGTVHTQQDLEKVRKMLAKEINK